MSAGDATALQVSTQRHTLTKSVVTGDEFPQDAEEVPCLDEPRSASFESCPGDPAGQTRVEAYTLLISAKTWLQLLRERKAA